ncbi:MAG: hypothetical protein GEU94_10445 [Micromonosporaceae bacterium]|nr:hypothetical protein [Micromonosporaceae bacterium]
MKLRAFSKNSLVRFFLPGVLVLTLGFTTAGSAVAGVTPAAKPGNGPPADAGQLRPEKTPKPPKPVPQPDGEVEVEDPGSALAAAATQPAAGAEKVALRSLIIALDENDFGVDTWSSLLDRVGAPYDVLLAKNEPLTADQLVTSDGTGRYQAILLTNNSLLYQDGSGNFLSAFDADEWNALWQYERDYAIRQVSLYTGYGTFPEDYCLRPGSEGGVGNTPINASLTSTGLALFDRLKVGVKIPISLSYVYYSAIEPNCGARPILTSGSDVLGVLSTSADGRERAALTFTSNQWLPQSYLLTYGLFRWATRGVFAGEQRHYLEVDVDDWFTSTDHLLADGTYASKEFRMSGPDAYNAYRAQNSLRSKHPLAKQFTLNVAYNGEGINSRARSQCSTLLTPDSLTSYSRCLRNQFRWINHTLTHPKMNFTPYAENVHEIKENLRVGRNIQLTVPTPVLKTGEYSGLGVYHPDVNNDIDPPTDHGLMASNAELLRAAKDTGVKYLHGNMSFGSHQPACFNCGIYHPMEPSLLIVPDWPTNVAYHVTTPAEETTFYNSYYGPNGKFPYWGHNLNYGEILDWESDIALQHVMSGSAYSHTFHQGNLRQYSSGKNLTFDWVNAVAAKYSNYYRVPMLTPKWTDLAGYVANRNAHFDTDADMVWDRATNTLVASSDSGGKVFLTGVRAPGYSTYGAESISLVSLTGGVPAVLTPTPWSGP